MPTITIFGSSQVKEKGSDYKVGLLLGKELVRAGFTVCNGGYGGMMEATARGAKEAGGRTLGVTAEDFGGPANRWIDREVRMKRWSERLFKLIEIGDGYIVFDGGTGTLVELFVVWEMLNKQFITKPIVLLGKQLQKLITQIRKFPYVVGNPHLCFAPSPAGAVKLIQAGVASASQGPGADAVRE